MPSRDDALHLFVQKAGWADAQIRPLAGDASNRRYLRLTRTGQSAVLMDAPAEKGEDIRPFMQITSYLRSIGLSAPEIFSADQSQGFMLLEDLGDDLFARIIPAQPDLEFSLYLTATDLLVHLHAHAPPDDLAAYDVPTMADMAALSIDWYHDAVNGTDASVRTALHRQMTEALQVHCSDLSVLIQRDYHSENLLWRPERSGVARVGLLDFQDAMLGHPAYDLVSLLQDARRDVPPGIEADMLSHYIAATNQDSAAFTAAYHVLGAQRNLRILGVFTRLCIRDGKTHYVDLIPRVWALLKRDLSHPALSTLSKTVSDHLPSPTPDTLQLLKDQCQTHPAP